ncbi:hypothetical protein ABIB06_006586 [Bradyrhizobium sp. LB8.2]|uniref:hypothetical protein n=1 Tax=unclassified Bradyrhizobium TaxID=2631580 RepID=UPI0033968CD8
MDAISPPSIKERPIIFSAPMVRAILEGRKTQTRRIVSLRPNKQGLKLVPELLQQMGVGAACPYGKPGDRLWVREAFRPLDIDITPMEGPPRVLKGAGLEFRSDFPDSVAGEGWKPSIYMPRWASRILLEIVGVRVERLQDISEADCDAEGFGGKFPPNAFPEFSGLSGWDGSDTIEECFGSLWDHINGKGAWKANPWVWVIEFKRVLAA